MTKLESDVQSKMMRIIRKYGGYVYKNAQNMYTEKGRPDLTACVPIELDRAIEIFGKDATVGLFVSIEVKRNKKVYDSSDAQIIVGRQIQKASGIWLSIDDPDIVEAMMTKFVTKGDAQNAVH